MSGRIVHKLRWVGVADERRGTPICGDNVLFCELGIPKSKAAAFTESGANEARRKAHGSDAAYGIAPTAYARNNFGTSRN